MGHSEDRAHRREESRATALRDDHGLEVIGHRHAADLDISHEELPYEEPDQFGIRITWQSEAERLEAAEFLVATRIQEDTRRRTSREVDEMRQRADDDPTEARGATEARDATEAAGPDGT